MAVTFETPDPGIKERPYVEQIPLDTLFRGMGYKQQEYDQNYQQLQSNVNALDSIQAIPGADETELQKIKDAFSTQLRDFSGANLMDPGVKAKLSGLINSTTGALTNSGIPQRSSAYKTFNQNLNELQLKGKKATLSMQPGYTSMQEYINSGKFDPTTRFDPTITPDPDFEKLFANLDKLKGSGKTVIDKSGNVTTTDEVTPERVMQAITMDPEMSDYYNRSAEAAWKTAKGELTDDQYAKKTLADEYSTLQAQIPGLRSPAAVRVAVDSMHQIQDKLNSNNPALGASYKRDFTQNHIYGQVSDHAGAWAWHTEKADAHGTIAQLEHQYRESEEAQKQVRQAQIDAGSLMDPLTGKPFPGKAEIAGETAALKKRYTSNGNGVFINSNLDDFHTYSKTPEHADFVRDPVDQKVKVTNLDNLWQQLGINDPGYGDGWRQINNESFLKNWKRDNDIGTTQNSPVIASISGAPAVYIKGEGKDAKVIVGISNNGKDVSSYREVSPNGLFAAEYNHAGTKNAPLLMNSKDANVSGNYTDATDNKTPTTPIILKGTEPTTSFKVGQSYTLHGKTGTWDGKHFVKQ